MRFRSSVIFIITVLWCGAAFAQQTGAIGGSVRDSSGAALPGVTVEARSPVLPQARVTTTEGDGDYQLPQLPPGDYTLTFTLAGMQTQTRTVRVLLNQTASVNVTLGLEVIAETITVTADSSLVDPTSTEIETSVSTDIIEQVPVGTNYRDLIKLAPGVQVVAEDTVRGPAGGGSEQDNVYQFDGVNISMPQYGVLNLNTEPSSHDIAQVSYNKGGAKAVDFVRAAGFTVDSVSKSGTNEFSGEVSYRIQDSSLVADVTELNNRRYDQDRSWASVGIGGPLLRERLFFYGSYFRPTTDQTGGSNVYGPVPDFEKTRDEFFGKLTFTPTSNILINASYRDSEEETFGSSVGSFETATNEVRSVGTFNLGIVEASWLFNNRSFATFKFNDFANEGLDRPVFAATAQASITGNPRLEINNLEQMGQFFVPEPLPNPRNDVERNFNQIIVPVIERYGYLLNGQRVGGGVVGVDSDINPQDFFRQSAQIGYDFTIGETLTHDFHVGYQWFRDEEDLVRLSNGWGDITFEGGRKTFQGQPVIYQALFLRANLPDAAVRSMHSEYESHNIEINDTIQWNDWSFNAGVMVSQDTLFGQGLRNDPSTISGFVLAPGSKYEMYKIDWEDMIQPRFGATWAYNQLDTVYASYARYNTAVSSLPRAASWDRNQGNLLMEAYFDIQGNFIGAAPRGSSTGKLFADDLEPRHTDEYIIGTSQQFSSRWAGRAYGRYRYSTNFWEDTQNNARVNFQPPPGIPRELYIPDLVDKLRQIGTGGSNGSYVIAQLDDAFTKYYEATLETDFRATDTLTVRGSYTWSHYYGNFDQDNTTTSVDFLNFVGSSNLADGAGRQTWDRKYGNLRSNRPHLLKVYGYYTLPWRASAGAYAVYQSGHRWEAWDYRPYSHLTGSTSVSNRYAEPAGSRETDPHYQLDLNYTQNIPIAGYNFQIEADMFNVFDRQTGYNPNPDLNSARFGQPQLFHAPRRVQIGARFQF